MAGVEGIYNLSLWDQYDSDYWHGQFNCSTYRAFGDPGVCASCWDAGATTLLASRAEAEGMPPTPTLLVHSPQDTWVQAAQAEQMAAASEASLPRNPVTLDVGGHCASGQHEDVLHGASARLLAACLLRLLPNRTQCSPDMPAASAPIPGSS
jgi:hypothetical protein